MSAGIGLFAGIVLMDLSNKKDKQHIKVQRVGCHQFRINEFTNEVKHLEGCNNPEHLEQ